MASLIKRFRTIFGSFTKFSSFVIFDWIVTTTNIFLQEIKENHNKLFKAVEIVDIRESINKSEQWIIKITTCILTLLECIKILSQAFKANIGYISYLEHILFDIFGFINNISPNVAFLGVIFILIFVIHIVLK